MLAVDRRRFLKFAMSSIITVTLSQDAVALATRRINVGAPAAGELWNGDFQTGNFSQWSNGAGQIKPGHGIVTKATSPAAVNDGKYWFRASVEPGDYFGTNPTAERCETFDGTSASSLQAGEEHWRAFSFVVDPSFNPPFYGNSYDEWHIITDYHSSTNGYTHQLQIKVLGINPLRMELEFECQQGTGIPGQGAGNTAVKAIVLPDIVAGKRYDILWHQKATQYPDKTGYVEFWADGARALEPLNLATVYSTGQLCYPKVGFYRHSASTIDTIWHQGQRICSSYSAAIAQFPTAWPASPPA